MLRKRSRRSRCRRETTVGSIDLDDGMPISEDGIAEACAKHANDERYDGEGCLAGCYSALIILVPGLYFVFVYQSKEKEERRE